MRITLQALGVVTMGCFLGCGKNDKDKSTPTTNTSTEVSVGVSTGTPTPPVVAWKSSIQSFVKKDDLKPKQKLRETTAEDVKTAVEGLGFTFHDPTTSDDAKCMNDLLSEEKFTVKDKVAYFHAEFDASACQNGEGSANKVDFVWDLALECENGDLSGIHEKTLQEFEELSNQDGFKLCSDGKFAQLHQTKVKVASEMQTEFGMIAVENQIITAQSTQDGLPCIRDIQGAVTRESDTCQIVNLSSTTKFTFNGTTQADQLVDDYMVQSFRGLEAKGEKDLWYSSGAMDVTINDWQGRVEYTSATAAPKYSITRKSETVKGTIPAPSQE